MKKLLSIITLFVLIVPSSTIAQPDTLNWIKSINVSTTSGVSYDLSFGFNEEATDDEYDLGAQFCSDGIQDNSLDCSIAGICEGGGIEWEYGTPESFCGDCDNGVDASIETCEHHDGIWTPYSWESLNLEWYGDEYAPPPPVGGILDAALGWDGDRY